MLCSLIQDTVPDEIGPFCKLIGDLRDRNQTTVDAKVAGGHEAQQWLHPSSNGSLFRWWIAECQDKLMQELHVFSVVLYRLSELINKHLLLICQRKFQCIGIVPCPIEKSQQCDEGISIAGQTLVILMQNETFALVGSGWGSISDML